jgi:hypothetical protein
MLFAQNATGDITVTATDHLNVRHTLPVEDAGPLQDVPCITQIVVILDPGLDDIGDLAVRITASGQESNDALIGIGPVNPNTPSRFALADWDAATLGESQNISVWKDSSGNHNDAIQSDPVRQPAVSTNRDGIRSVRFDAFQYLQFPQLSNVRIVQAVIKYDLSLDNTDRLPRIIGHTINITWSGCEGTHIFGKDTSSLVTGGRAFWNTTPIEPRLICKPSQGYAVLTFGANADTVVNLIGSDRLGHFLRGNLVRLILYSREATTGRERGYRHPGKQLFPVSYSTRLLRLLRHRR